MQCKEVQERVVVDEISASDKDHLENCGDCGGFAIFAQGLEFRLEPMRQEQAPDGLRERIEKQVKGARSLQVRLLGLTGFSTAALAMVMVLGGHNSAEAAYKRLINQLKEVKSVHCVIYWRPGNGSVENGPLRKVEELWWVPGKLRETSPPEYGGDRIKLQTSSGWTFSRVDAGTGKVETVPEVGQQLTRFDIESLSGVYMHHPATFERNTLSETSELVTATDAQGWSRIEFYVNRKTGLPYHAKKEYRQGDKWLQSGSLDLEFNVQIPASEFDPATLGRL